MLKLLAVSVALALPPVLGDAGAPQPGATVPVADAQEVSLLELANVEWTRGKKLPKAVRDLKGKSVKLVGYMSLDTEEGQSSFRMSYESCSCSTSKVTHFVKVTMPEGEVTKFEPGLIEAVGTFYPGAKYDDDGFVDSVFRLRAKSVETH